MGSLLYSYLLSYLLSAVRHRAADMQMFPIVSQIIMRPSSLGGGRILRRTLSVRLSVRPSRYRCHAVQCF